MTKLIEADYLRYQAQILGIREAVFIVEQGVPAELEVDAQDPNSRHLLLFDKNKPIATARLTVDGHIGRLAVLKAQRHKGYGCQLIKRLEKMAAETGLPEVKLGAQLQAIRFYEKLGYRAYGETFIDAGIEHRMMKNDYYKQA